MAPHSTTIQIRKLLDDNSCPYDYFEHEPVRTSEEAAKVRPSFSLRQGAKAMIIRVKFPSMGKKFVMLVIPGDTRFDNDKVKKFFKAKDIRFATNEEIKTLTNGVQTGGIPPFGNLFGLEVVADPKLFLNDKIIFNAGDRCVSIAMKSRDYEQIVGPIVTDIT